MAADVIRNSFQEQKSYCRVTFQRNRDVCDFELNEAQQIAEVREIKAMRNALGDDPTAFLDGLLVTSDNATANTLTVRAGVITFKGYTVELFNDVPIVGLSTPGGARADCVYLKLDQVEINSSADPAIATQALGETAIRTKLRLTLGVNEGSANPPADTGQPWAGGAIYGKLANLYRTAAAVVAPNQIVDRRANAADAFAAQMANVFMEADSVSWDGTTLAFKNLSVTYPQQLSVSPGHILYQGDVSFTPTAGQACGFTGETGKKLRRNVRALTGFGASEDGTTAVMGSIDIGLLNWTTRDTFLLAWRNGGDIVLRNGVVLRSGDVLDQLGRASSSRGPDPAGSKPYAAQMVYADHAGNMRHAVDRIGYPMGARVSHVHSEWIATPFGGTNLNYEWNSSSTGGTGSVTNGATTPSATYGANSLQFTPATSGSGFCYVISSSALLRGDASWLSCVLEFEVGLNAALAGTSSNVTAYFGLCKSGSNPSVSGSSHVVLCKSNAAANYKLSTRDELGGNAFIDSGIAPTVGTEPKDKIRIELHGSGSPYGNKAFLFINDVFATQSTTSLPGGVAMSLWFGLFNEAGAPSGSPLAYLGPVDVTFNRFLTNAGAL